MPITDLAHAETARMFPNGSEAGANSVSSVQLEQLVAAQLWAISGQEMSRRWQELSSRLMTFSPDALRAAQYGEGRRWELVSAYQKSVRRADVETALKIVQAFDAIPQHRPYLWRRLLTTVGEDVGPADPVLVAFALHCSVVFSKATGEVQQRVLAFLTIEMCSLRNRSRVWCSLCVIADKARECVALSDPAKGIVQLIEQLPTPETPIHAWLKRKSWLTEGMSKYAVLDHLWDLVPVDAQPEVGVTLYGLPSYCYDMHTRVGRLALRFCSAIPVVQQFFDQYRPMKKVDVLGWALFYAEGGCIAGELVNPLLQRIEREVAFASFGLARQAGDAAIDLMRRMVASGALNDLRYRALVRTYGAGVVA